MQQKGIRNGSADSERGSGQSGVADFPAVVTVLLLTVMLTGCPFSDSDSSNQSPMANAGTSQAVDVLTTVTLNGSGSDPEGDPLSFLWSIQSAPTSSAATLMSATSARPSVTPDIAGEYTILLSVDDGFSPPGTDTVTIIAVEPGTLLPPTNPPANIPPVADAGLDKTVDTLTSVNLDGSGSSDADGQVVSYAWTFQSTPPGSNAELTLATAAGPGFTPDIVGDYVVTLSVEDDAGATDTDTVTIIAEAPVVNPPATSPPVADAGAGRTVDNLTPVNLDGGGSSDADGDTLSYLWAFQSVPQGSTASLTGAMSVNSSFTPDIVGDYVVVLTVDDGVDGTDTDTVTIVAVAPNTSPPVADAGPAQQVAFQQQGVTVQLDGRQSTPDPNLLTFSWEIIDFQPSDALDPAVPVVLIGPTTENPVFDVNAIDQLGTYTIQLTVSDGALEDSDTVVIEVEKAFPAASVFLGSGLLVGAVFGIRRRKYGRGLTD